MSTFLLLVTIAQYRKQIPLSAVLTQLLPARRHHKIAAAGASEELVLAVLAGVAAPPPSQPREQLLAPIEHNSGDLSRLTLLWRFLQPELCF